MLQLGSEEQSHTTTAGFFVLRSAEVWDLLLGNVDVHFAGFGGIAAAVGNNSGRVILPWVGAEGGAIQRVVQRLRVFLGDSRDDGFQDVVWCLTIDGTFRSV